MVARVERKGHAIHTCKNCGRTDDDFGDWFWSNALCDQCSDCFPPSEIVVNGGRYSSPVPDTIQADRAYYARRFEDAQRSRNEQMLDPINISLTRNKGPHGVLLLAVVARAVEDIRNFRDRRKAKQKITVGRYNSLLMAAKLADGWIMSDHGSRITIKHVALYHDMDLAYLRQSIYDQFDPHFIERMRRLPMMGGKTASVSEESDDA